MSMDSERNNLRKTKKSQQFNTCGYQCLISAAMGSIPGFWKILIFLCLVIGFYHSLAVMVFSDFQVERLQMENGLPHNTIYCQLQDKRGFMWFGTADGLARFDGYEFVVFKHNEADSTTISSNDVTALHESLEDSDLMWVGTANGLNAYHRFGESFSVIRTSAKQQSLCGNYITAIYESKANKGVLWVGTSVGLNQLTFNQNQQLQKIQCYVHDPAKPNSLSSSEIKAICQVASAPHMVWVGTSRGLNGIDRKTGSIFHYLAEATVPDSLSNNYVYALAADPVNADCLWIGTSNGLNCFDLKKNSFEVVKISGKNSFSLLSHSIWALCFDSFGRLWVGTYGGGVLMYDRQKNSFQSYGQQKDRPDSLSSNDVSSVYEDRFGVIWIGTYEGGVNKYYPNQLKFKLIQNNLDSATSLGHNYVKAFFESVEQPGIIWIGTYDGLDKYDSLKEEFLHFRSFGSNNISVIYESPLAPGLLWIGTVNGLHVWDEKKSKFNVFKNTPGNDFSLSDNRITALCEDQDSFFWIGTMAGLNRFDRKKNQFECFYHQPNAADSLSHNEVLSIYQQKNGSIWVGTAHGLNQFQAKSKTFIRYVHHPQDENSLPGNHISVIHEMDLYPGVLWIGTNQGISKFDPKANQWAHYKKSGNIQITGVIGLVEEKTPENPSHLLWLSTANQGLIRFDTRNEKFSFYTPKDNLQGWVFNEGAYAVSRNGLIYFGGINGINVINLAAIKEDKFRPQMVITDFQLFNKSVAAANDSVLRQSIVETDLIVLNHRQYNLTFKFAALHYGNPEKNHYAYRLDGLDNQWIAAGNQRFVNYSYLAPKTYVFYVKGSNCDGLWSEQPTSLTIKIVPPFWQTLWFRLLLLIGLVVFSLSLHFWRIKAVELQKKRLEEKVVERTREVNLQKTIIETKNLQIISSIQYAEQIQSAMLPEKQKLTCLFADNFVFYKPKSIVSGDFYWFSAVKGKIMIAVADCTGHGVPGAFMSIIGISKLDQNVNEKQLSDPALILANLHENIRQALKQESQTSENTDGMDIGLCSVSEKTGKLVFAGAKRPLYLIRKAVDKKNKEFVEIKGDRKSIGGHQKEKKRKFSNQTVTITSGDMIYLTTDGFIDQQNTVEKKFGSRRFKELLFSIAHLPLPEQCKKLESELSVHQAGGEQQDDITVVGVRLP